MDVDAGRRRCRVGVGPVRSWRRALHALLPPQRTAQECRIALSFTACNYGGARPWLVCPSCARRVACLYFVGPVWACRKCCDLVYQTQREQESGRLLLAAWKMRERLGQTGGSIFDPYPKRPRGMWTRTYWRLKDRGRDKEIAWLDSGTERFNRHRARVEKLLGAAGASDTSHP